MGTQCFVSFIRTIIFKNGLIQLKYKLFNSTLSVSTIHYLFESVYESQIILFSVKLMTIQFTNEPKFWKNLSICKIIYS